LEKADHRHKEAYQMYKKRFTVSEANYELVQEVEEGKEVP